jgi:hypothetical protein
MILQTFDIGWGNNFKTKQLEQELLAPLLSNLSASEKTAVIINSTWYTDDYHNEVIDYLKTTPVDYIVLISMLDFSIPRADRYSEINATVLEIGYYNSPGNIDYWALFLDRYFYPPHTIDLCRIDLIDCPFMCLNRKPHDHRVELYDQLQQLGLHTKGIVSLGGTTGVAVQSAETTVPVIELAPNSGHDQFGIPNDISSLGDMGNWRRTFLNVVTETVYDINECYFVSEKIYKPILGLRPFLVYAADGGEQWLADRGFVNYLDDFTDITDIDLRHPENIAPFLSVLCNQSRQYWQYKLVDLNQKIVYNKEHFYKYVDLQKLKIQKGIIWPV